ncbi:MAG TPA: ESX secretion-associated protein EspG [Mycobacterium sp.]|nr:ESX secretion-associated protein EspG [Mycobacterium sp.]
MLTTTVDGLWVLQVLSGAEAVAPELGLRPILPSVETRQLALAHPAAADLRSAGVIDDDGAVDIAVREWLTVLSRREVALVVHLHRPDGDAPARVVIARFAQWWVVMERSAEFIRIGGAGTATAEGAANSVLIGQIERLCGTMPAARFQPVTLDSAPLRRCGADPEKLRAYLVGRGLDGEQVQIIMAAADPQRSAQASFAALQTGIDAGGPTRTHVGHTVVTVLDTPQGRLVAEQVTSAGRTWIIVGPGTATGIATAINQMLRHLPADQEWHSYRKVV